jgi:hypothetical protein
MLHYAVALSLRMHGESSGMTPGDRSTVRGCQEVRRGRLTYLIVGKLPLSKYCGYKGYLDFRSEIEFLKKDTPMAGVEESADMVLQSTLDDIHVPKQ